MPLTNEQSEQIGIRFKTNWDRTISIIFGLVFISLVLSFTYFYPEPTAAQYTVYKTVLALASAGIGAVLPGILSIEFPLPKGVIRASGAIVLFVVVFFFTPVAPNSLPNESFETNKGSPKINQIVEEGGQGAIHTGEGDINIGIEK